MTPARSIANVCPTSQEVDVRVTCASCYNGVTMGERVLVWVHVSVPCLTQESTVRWICVTQWTVMRVSVMKANVCVTMVGQVRDLQVNNWKLCYRDLEK